MAYDDGLAQRVRKALGTGRAVTEKPMFGGLAFMVREKMCVTVGKGRIMCRIDPAIHDAVAKRQGCQAVVMRGRPYRGYIRVDASALSTKRQLDYWVQLALGYNDKLTGAVSLRPRSPGAQTIGSVTARDGAILRSRRRA